MARDVKIDPDTMDVEFPIQYVSGKAELQQALLSLLMTPKGTYLDRNVGMDYSFILGSNFNFDEARLAIVKALKQDRRVEDVPKVDMTKNDNQVTFHISVNTTLGTLDFDKGVINNNA